MNFGKINVWKLTELVGLSLYRTSPSFFPEFGCQIEPPSVMVFLGWRSAREHWRRAHKGQKLIQGNHMRQPGEAECTENTGQGPHYILNQATS